MALSHEQKEILFKKILDVMQMGAEAGALEQYELNDISEYSLKRANELNSEGEIRMFYEELSDRWPVFGILLEEEDSRVKERAEEEATEGAATLLQHGKIDEALALVKSATTT